MIGCCALCYEDLDENSYEAWEETPQDGMIVFLYCHNPDWVIPGGTCWEKRVLEDFPECEEWLYYGFECEGCTPDEWGECTCTTDKW